MSGESDPPMRVVLVDPAGELAAVGQALAGSGEIALERADSIPSGHGIVGLLVAPEWHVGARQLQGLPDVRVIAATSTGYDHLDLEAIAAAGAWATHCPGYCDEEVAEHAIAFSLDLLRGITLLDRAVHAGDWDHRLAAPRRVAGAVLGIIGLGRIGRRVSERAIALGMRVLACDPAVSATGQAQVELVALADLLQAADVVTLHAPLTPDTRGLLGEKELALMRPGSFLVNCARAALVDHDALGRALLNGHLGGCALDVLPSEPPSALEPALSWPRTVINPHAAWYSPDAATAPYRIAGEAVAAVLAEREPAGVLARPRRAPTCASSGCRR
jgi:D-3-phosphoglycerate dehydrogenase